MFHMSIFVYCVSVLFYQFYRFLSYSQTVISQLQSIIFPFQKIFCSILFILFSATVVPIFLVHIPLLHFVSFSNFFSFMLCCRLFFVLLFFFIFFLCIYDSNSYLFKIFLILVLVQVTSYPCITTSQESVPHTTPPV